MKDIDAPSDDLTATRDMAAMFALAGLLAFPGLDGAGQYRPDAAARDAVRYADALVAELTKEEPT